MNLWTPYMLGGIVLALPNFRTHDICNDGEIYSKSPPNAALRTTQKLQPAQQDSTELMNKVFIEEQMAPAGNPTSQHEYDYVTNAPASDFTQ